jgi:hypothetical protein
MAIHVYAISKETVSEFPLNQLNTAVRIIAVCIRVMPRIPHSFFSSTNSKFSTADIVITGGEC